MKITPKIKAFGAEISGVDLSGQLNPELKQDCINALLEHKVIAFPDQNLSDDALERVSCWLGPFGHDPFIAPIPDREHIIAVCRGAEEKAPIFAENWHTDWSFQAEPPAATCLYGITIPSCGGDTWYADQIAAAEGLPKALRTMIEGKRGVHSAKLPYAPDGVYGDNDRRSDRTMDIRADTSAHQTFSHPLLSPHPQTGLERLFGCVGYIIGIEEMPEDEAVPLLMELLAHQTQDEYVYQHQWQEGMLVIWDNRSVLHKATGGYEGQARLLHRTTIQGFA